MSHRQQTVAERLIHALKKGDPKLFNNLRQQYPKVTELAPVNGEIVNQTLSGFRMTGLVLRNIKFTNVRFTGNTRLERVTFESCLFVGCRFFGICVQGMRLLGATCNSCVFEEINFLRVDVRGHTFKGDFFLGCKFNQMVNAQHAQWLQVTIDEHGQSRIVRGLRLEPKSPS